MWKFGILVASAILILGFTTIANAQRAKAEVAPESVKALMETLDEAEICIKQTKNSCDEIPDWKPCKWALLDIFRWHIKILMDWVITVADFGLSIALSLFNSCISFIRVFFSGCLAQCKPCAGAVGPIGIHITDELTACQKNVDTKLKDIQKKDFAENAADFKH